MRIKLENHFTEWQQKFESLKKALNEIIGFANPHIDHIGSTAVKDLSAKPIIDILVGLPDNIFLDQTVKPLIANGFIFYELYNEIMPYRRFFVKHSLDNSSIPNPIKLEEDVPKSTEEHDTRLAHIHIIKFKSEHWKRHIAFRDYLKAHPKVRSEYQRLKENLSCREWIDGNHYNQAKNEFIKNEEYKALLWFDNNNR